MSRESSTNAYSSDEAVQRAGRDASRPQSRNDTSATIADEYERDSVRRLSNNYKGFVLFHEMDGKVRLQFQYRGERTTLATLTRGDD